MLSENIRQALRDNIQRYEGKVNHMYLDTRGFVTVGVGHLLATVVDAQELGFLEGSDEPASTDVIAAEYEQVKAQEMARVASYYKQFTALHLTDESIDQITDKHIDSFYKELKVIYDGFDDFPEEAKLALFDMIFNLGMTGLRKKWPRFNTCVANKDWAAAANDCRRRGIADERNDYVKDLLVSASELVV